MKCEKCVSEGEQSSIQAPAGGVSTAIASAPYYDNEGIYHHHDPNSFTSAYSCSRGHRWVRSTRSGCPAGDYEGTVEVSWLEDRAQDQPGPH